MKSCATCANRKSIPALLTLTARKEHHRPIILQAAAEGKGDITALTTQAQSVQTVDFTGSQGAPWSARPPAPLQA